MGCGASTAAPQKLDATPTTAPAPAKKSAAPAQLTAKKSAALDRTPLLRQVFAAMDADGDGTIDLKEFLLSAKSAEEQDMELPMMHSFMDENGDGVLSFEEWAKGIDALGVTDVAFEREMKDVLQAIEGAKAAAASAS